MMGICFFAPNIVNWSDQSFICRAVYSDFRVAGFFMPVHSRLSSPWVAKSA